jgi:PPM family protein phosphatase
MTSLAHLDVRTGGLVLTVGAGSDIGRRYPANFDVLHVEAPASGAASLLAVVADGMGAGEGSATAGRTAVGTFVEAVRGLASPVDPAVLRGAVAEAQRRVRAAGDRLGELTGCTLTALVVEGGAGWIVQIGDSRAYRWRRGLLELLTVDHTQAWLGAVNGWYPADSPQAAAARYQLTRYMGHPDLPEPDVLNVALRPGDVLCLCSDGLAEQVPYRRLAAALESAADPAGDPAAVAAGLLADALAAGGNDNATVVVVRVGSATHSAGARPE